MLHPRFFRSSSTPSTSKIFRVTNALWSREVVAPLAVGLHDVSPLATDDTEVVEVHEASSRCSRAVSPGCRSAVRQWQHTPDAANGGEPAPTRLHQRGFEEREPVNYPADDIKLLSCGVRVDDVLPTATDGTETADERKSGTRC